MSALSKITEISKALHEERAELTIYLARKAKVGDWHGVADAAMDIREVNAKLEVLSMVLEEVGDGRR